MRRLFANNSLGTKEDPLYSRIRLSHSGDKNAPLFKKFINDMHAVTHLLFDQDNDFHHELPLKGKFVHRLAEMYLAATLRYRLRLLIIRLPNGGPDFFLNKSNCWFEVTTASTGAKNNVNSIPELIPNTFQPYPEDQFIMRLTNSFIHKSEKINEYIQDGIVGSSHPVVICISGSAMGDRRPMHAKGGFPPIVKALLPIDDFFQLNLQTNTFSVVSEHRPSINKKTSTGDKPIYTNFFLQDSHAHISAVIYSQEILIEQEKWGCDFITVHNPKAKNPLQKWFIKCGKEYLTACTEDGFQLKQVDHEQSRTYPPTQPQCMAGKALSILIQHPFRLFLRLTNFIR